MEKKEMLYEGKAKKVYTTEDPDVLIVSYKDDATAFNGLKKGTIVGKGAINNRMTNFIFKKLEEKGVPTHLVEELNDRETAVKKVEIVPLEVIIRNYSAGSFAKKMGMEEGIKFKCPTLEFSYKNDDLGDPFINSYYALALGLATQEEIDRCYQDTVIQEETDIILEGEMKFFVWVSRERWGFVVLPILREGEVLYKGEETFFDFEDDTWELNFFDGRK